MFTSKSLPAETIICSEINEKSRFVAGLMVFFGSFLAFSMEPIVGRMITPFFGGAVHVWLVSLMVFQALLLAGYLYAHFVAPRIGAWHFLFLLLPLLQLPLDFVSKVAPKAPIVALVASLLAQTSLPFAALSTTAVVAQSWWFGSSIYPQRSEPFFLYGISNLGAMMALFAYPFLAEPLFGVKVQCIVWSVGYLFYVGAAACTWYHLRPQFEVRKAKETTAPNPSRNSILSWLVLGAAPSALLLAVTNVIATEVGSFPMVWVIPLAIYLSSFTVTFNDHEGFIVSRVDFWLIDIALLALVVPLFLSHTVWALFSTLLAYYGLCIIANKRLYSLRPHPNHLTSFYLMISTGGWLGGLLVSLAAPLVFSGLTEYPITVAIIVLACWQQSMIAWWRSANIIKGSLRLVLLMVGCTVIGLYLWYSSDVYSLRNFFGISRIVDKLNTDSKPYRMLVHGKTLHGLQYLTPEDDQKPLGYYYKGGALEQALLIRPRPARVAMIGLGAGGAMPWFGKDDEVEIFEIDPDMELVARNWFSYLEKTPAQTSIYNGDARLKLGLENKDHANPYDVVFIDAFSGDGIPTHLMTLEALDIYLSRLKEDGFLVFHVSNRYYDLRPTLKAAALSRKLAAVTTIIVEESSDSPLRINPSVVVLARRPELLSPLLLNGKWSVIETNDSLPEVDVWTDDYVNILVPLFTNWLMKWENCR